MIDRTQIEEFLKLNGLSPSSPDEEIKSILISARWNKDDVETALLVLRENSKSHQSHVDSLHRVFQSDEKMSPEAISALLGVDLDVDRDAISHTRGRTFRGVSLGQMMQIAIVSVALSIVFIIGSMWFLQIGIFHVTIR